MPETTDQASLAVNDLVCFRNGDGPTMVVSEVFPEEDKAMCLWFNNDDELRGAKLPLAILKVTC